MPEIERFDDIVKWDVDAFIAPAPSAPLTPYYDLAAFNAAARPVANSLPLFSGPPPRFFTFTQNYTVFPDAVVDMDEEFPPGTRSVIEGGYGVAEITDDDGFLLKPGTPEHSRRAKAWTSTEKLTRYASGMMDRQTRVMKAQAAASMTPMTEEEVETAKMLHDLEPWGERVGPEYFEVFHSVKAQMEELSDAWEKMTRNLMNALPMFQAPRGGVVYAQPNRAERRGRAKAKRLCPVHGQNSATCRACWRGARR